MALNVKPQVSELVEATQERPRVVLADDHALLLDAFEKLLTPQFHVVGKATDGRSLLTLAEQVHPDVVVLDMMMPCLNGLDAARQLRERHAHLGLVFLTMMEDPEIAAETIRLGACGYVLKRSAASELVSAIREVLRKRSYVTPLITGDVIEVLQRAEPDRHRDLTTRQREILQLIAEGQSMKAIADILYITPRTVAYHKYRMMEELHISTTAQLIQFAVKQRVV